MKDKMKMTVTTEVVKSVSVSISSARLLEFLDEIIPPGATKVSISIQVPGGGDYSSLRLEPDDFQLYYELRSTESETKR